MDEQKRELHQKAIECVLKYVNAKSKNFVLKGGTALMECYGLDRFSEDIDFDGMSPDILDILQEFCFCSSENTYDISDMITMRRILPTGSLSIMLISQPLGKCPSRLL